MSGALRGEQQCKTQEECIIIRESKKGRKVDALAHRGDEGRDKLR